mgnify:CR=1 FL=1
MGAKKKVETAKSMLDRLTLNTGLAVTPPGPATTKQVMKRGRNTLAGGTGLAAGAGVLAATGPDRSSRKGKLDSTVDDMKAKRAEAKKAREAKEAARKKKNAATREASTKRSKASKGGTAPGIMTRDSGVKSKAKAESKPTAKPTTKTWKDVKSVAAAKAAGLKNYTGKDGKKKAAIDASEIKKGESMTQAFNRIQGKTARKPSSKTTKSTTNTTTKTPKKVGGLRKFLLGDDGKFGGARGAIDFLPGKSRKKKEDKPVKKMGGGMMRSKMSSKGGARGGRNPMGMKNGGFPDLNKDGKVTQADILQGRGVVKKKAGGMAKKGYAKGGMTKKGYANGGAVNKTASRKPTKPRGVGVAKRGFGKAMR